MSRRDENLNDAAAIIFSWLVDTRAQLIRKGCPRELIQQVTADKMLISLLDLYQREGKLTDRRRRELERELLGRLKVLDRKAS